MGPGVRRWSSPGSQAEHLASWSADRYLQIHVPTVCVSTHNVIVYTAVGKHPNQEYTVSLYRESADQRSCSTNINMQHTKVDRDQTPFNSYT